MQVDRKSIGKPGLLRCTRILERAIRGAEVYLRRNNRSASALWPCWWAPVGGGPRLHPGRRRQRQALAEPLFFQQFREQERELDGLLGIEPRVAEGVIPIVKVFIADRAGA